MNNTKNPKELKFLVYYYKYEKKLTAEKITEELKKEWYIYKKRYIENIMIKV